MKFPVSHPALRVTDSWRNTQAKETTRDPLMVAYGERVLNGLVYELYFPEEVHAAGLRLFDLVAQAALPELPHAETQRRKDKGGVDPDASLRASASSRDTSFLPRLRQLFETLHDGAHPLRLALEKLATLDTVRIIEGKE